MACTQTRVSYNKADLIDPQDRLWLALRRGSVIIDLVNYTRNVELWLALRRGSVIIIRPMDNNANTLWLALRRGSVIITYYF